ENARRFAQHLGAAAIAAAELIERRELGRAGGCERRRDLLPDPGVVQQVQAAKESEGDSRRSAAPGRRNGGSALPRGGQTFGGGRAQISAAGAFIQAKQGVAHPFGTVGETARRRRTARDLLQEVIRAVTGDLQSRTARGARSRTDLVQSQQGQDGS